MKNLLIILTGIILLSSCSGNAPKEANLTQTAEVNSTPMYENELFSCDYPYGYKAVEFTTNDDEQYLVIRKDDLDDDETIIKWKSPGTFPLGASEFVNLSTSLEIDEFKKSNTFYDVMKIDSTYTIDGYPTYTIASIFEEGPDTIIQCRIGMIIPQKFDMMITQKINVKSSVEKVQEMSDIIETIKFKF